MAAGFLHLPLPDFFVPQQPTSTFHAYSPYCTLNPVFSLARIAHLARNRPKRKSFVPVASSRVLKNPHIPSFSAAVALSASLAHDQWPSTYRLPTVLPRFLPTSCSAATRLSTGHASTVDHDRSLTHLFSSRLVLFSPPPPIFLPPQHRI